MTDRIQLNIRVAPEIKEALRQRAEEKNRSLNNYLEILLTDLVNGWKESEQEQKP